MKKISRLLTVVFVLCMAFSTVAFAAEPEMSAMEGSDIQLYASEIADEVSIEPREPAAPLSRATITDIYMDTDTGRVYADVEVVGYGSTFGYINGSRVSLSASKPIGSPIVTGFKFTFDCGVLSSGTYTFRYSGTSYNRPWNTISVEATFTVP
ncbi:MAG: hypothetical protein K2M60_12145 [Lachnospiraceae bacterium]|nr:hypothetical protein [Lachnospiraceae bacterium]MDE6252621.1 hypothetical protein [Lachnospiraceae bacterium]